MSSNNFENYVCLNIDLAEKQKILRQLYYLILSYANIYELYIERQIIFLSQNKPLESPNTWMNQFDSLSEFQHLCVGKTTTKQLSRTSLMQLLYYGYKTICKRRRQIKRDKPWIKRHLLHQYLYDEDIWYRYSLSKPYLPIQASFEIEKQMFSKGKLRIPKYGYVNVDHDSLHDFPLGYVPVAGRLFIEQSDDGKLHGYVSVACTQMELDDGFVKLKRR
jgi:hypothetical protein